MFGREQALLMPEEDVPGESPSVPAPVSEAQMLRVSRQAYSTKVILNACLLYTSPSPRDGLLSRMPSSA